jgi:hypothetical protein
MIPPCFLGGTVSREKVISPRSGTLSPDVALKRSAAERNIDSWIL